MIISQGAEAVLREDGNRVRKERFARTYRHPELDKRLRTSRTNRERKMLERAVTLDIRVPKLHGSDGTTLVLERIDGPRLRDILLKQPERAEELRTVGTWVARLHDYGIIHGDLTTSNILVANGPVLIDFGLAQFSEKTEDKAVDLHVLEQTLESTHPRTHEMLFAAFLKGYADSDASSAVLDRLETVRARGRNK